MATPNYSLPPWLAQQAAPNPAAAYITALHQGAALGMEQAQMQQRRQLAEQELAARQAEQEQRATLEQQKIEYDHALSQAQMGLEQQQLDEAKQVADMKIQETSRRFAAQQRVQQAIADGVRPEEAMFREAANLDLGAGDLAALLRASRPAPGLAGGLVNIGEGYKSFQTGPNTRELIKPKAEVPAELKQATVNGQPVPNTFIGPKGQTVHMPRTSSDADTVRRKVLVMERNDAAKTLQSAILLERAVDAELALSPKTKRKDAKAKVVRDLQKRISDLDEEIKRTASGAASGSPAYRYIRGKGIQKLSSTATGTESSELSQADTEDEDNAG